MKHSKKIALLSSLAALVGVAGAGTIGANAEVTNPGAPTTFAIEQAAAIRVSSPYGIRFTANISAAEHEALTAYAESLGETVEYGMLIIPADLIPQDEALDANDAEGTLKEVGTETGDTDYTNNYYKIVAEPQANAENTEYAITAGIKQIKENNVSRPFAARAYALVGGTYYYTDTFERSIYTAATYAIDSIDADKTDALNYFKETVIDRVEAAYTTATVEITSESGDVAYDLASVGEVITATGYVSNGTKTLESKATLSDANLTHVAGKQYKVKDFGTVDTTADVGATAALTGKTLQVKEKYAEITQELADSDAFYKKWGSSVNPFTYKEVFQGKEDVLRFDAVNKSSRFIVNKAVLQPVGGKYYVFDFYFTANVNVEWFWYYDGTKNYITKGDNGSQGNTYDRATTFYNDADAKATETATLLNPTTNAMETITLFEWRILDPLGNELNAPLSSNYGKWLTMEIYFPENEGWNFAYDQAQGGIAFYPAGNSEEGAHYFANFRLNDYKIQPSTLTGFRPVEELKDSYAQDEAVAFETTLTDTLGRTIIGGADAAVVTGGATTDATTGDVVVLLGDVTVSMEVAGATQSYTLVGPKTMNVPHTALISGLAYSNAVAAKTGIDITYEDEFMGNEDVAYVTMSKSQWWGVSFTKEYLDIIPVGASIYFELYIARNTNLYTGMFGHTNTTGALSSLENVNFYDATGAATSKSTTADAYPNTAVYHSWRTVEITNITHAPANVAMISGIDSNWSSSRLHIGIANIRVSLERLATTADEGATYTMNTIDATLPTLAELGTLELMPNERAWGLYLNHNVGATSSIGTKWFAPTTEEVGGVAAGQAFKWDSTQVGDGKGLFFNIPAQRIVNTAAANNAKWGQNYFYIDVYFDGEVDMSMNLGWNYANNISTMMGGTVNHYASSVKAYDKATGAELANVDLSLAENQGKWITLEVKSNTSAAMNMVNGWYFNAIAEGATAYFMNPMICTTARTFGTQA